MVRGIHRVSKWAFLVLVNNRSTETLNKVIEENVAPKVIFGLFTATIVCWIRSLNTLKKIKEFYTYSKTATVHRICLRKKLKITVHDGKTTVTLNITSP